MLDDDGRYKFYGEEFQKVRRSTVEKFSLHAYSCCVSFDVEFSIAKGGGVDDVSTACKTAMVRRHSNRWTSLVHPRQPINDTWTLRSNCLRLVLNARW